MSTQRSLSPNKKKWRKKVHAQIKLQQQIELFIIFDDGLEVNIFPKSINIVIHTCTSLYGGKEAKWEKVEKSASNENKLIYLSCCEKCTWKCSAFLSLCFLRHLCYFSDFDGLIYAWHTGDDFVRCINSRKHRMWKKKSLLIWMVFMMA